MAILLSSSCADPEQSVFEASMNFDLENVKSFLVRINNQLDLNLPIDDLIRMTRQTEIETEQSRTMQIVFAGSGTQLEYRVFMDDINAPDLAIFTPSQGLAESIQYQKTLLPMSSEYDRLNKTLHLMANPLRRLPAAVFCRCVAC